MSALAGAGFWEQHSFYITFSFQKPTQSTYNYPASRSDKEFADNVLCSNLNQFLSISFSFEAGACKLQPQCVEVSEK